MAKVRIKGKPSRMIADFNNLDLHSITRMQLSDVKDRVKLFKG